MLPVVGGTVDLGLTLILETWKEDKTFWQQNQDM